MLNEEEEEGHFIFFVWGVRLSLYSHFRFQVLFDALSSIIIPKLCCCSPDPTRSTFTYRNAKKRRREGEEIEIDLLT